MLSIPVKVYLATESSAAIKFKLMAASGARLRKQYVADAPPVRFDPGPADEVVTTRTVEPKARERDTVVSPLAAGNSRSFPSTVEFEAQDDEPRVIERAEDTGRCAFAKWA